VQFAQVARNVTLMSKKKGKFIYNKNIHYIKSLFIIKNKFLDDKAHSGVAPKINAALGVNEKTY